MCVATWLHNMVGPGPGPDIPKKCLLTRLGNSICWIATDSWLDLNSRFSLVWVDLPMIHSGIVYIHTKRPSYLLVCIWPGILYIYAKQPSYLLVCTWPWYQNSVTNRLNLQDDDVWSRRNDDTMFHVFDCRDVTLKIRIQADCWPCYYWEGFKIQCFPLSSFVDHTLIPFWFTSFLYY